MYGALQFHAECPCNTTLVRYCALRHALTVSYTASDSGILVQCPLLKVIDNIDRVIEINIVIK